VIDLQALAAGDRQAARVEAQLVQDGRVDVGDVVAVFDGVEAYLIGAAMNYAALDAAAGHPDGEAIGVVVAPVGALAAGGTSEFGGPDDEGVVEHAAALEVL